MDWKNTAIGLSLLAIAMMLMTWNSRQQPPPLEPAPVEEGASAPAPAPIVTEDRAPAETPGDTASNPPETNGNGSGLFTSADAPTAAPVDALEEAVGSRADEKLVVLENAFATIRFTTYGGAIRDVAFKEYPAEDDGEEPYVFNELGNIPALGLSIGSGSPDDFFAPAYTLTVQEENRVVFELEIDGVRIVREYTVSDAPEGTEGAAPYLIRHTLKMVNQTDEAKNIQRVYLHLGVAEPVESDHINHFLTFGYFDGEDHFLTIDKFKASGGFMGFGSRVAQPFIAEDAPIQWATVKNHFFTSIVTPDEPAVAFHTEPVVIGDDPLDRLSYEGVAGSIAFDLGTLAARGERELGMNLFVGPKEYPRIAELQPEAKQYRIMHYGWFGFISRLFTHILGFFHGLVGNYGLAIMFMTVALRTLMWPVTAQAAVMGRRMQHLREPMKRIQEKYKDRTDSQSRMKQQQEMMGLYKRHKVNPAAGCLTPMVQLPIFVGFFYMLRGASELRFEDFLWVADLSRPDTILSMPFPIIGTLDINPMPILMTLTMFVQMRVASPPAMDPTQKMLMQFMPFMMLIFLYNFASGLALYWTTSNLYSIGQQFVINRRLDKLEPPPEDDIEVETEEVKKPASKGVKPLRDYRDPQQALGKKKRK